MLRLGQAHLVKLLFNQTINKVWSYNNWTLPNLVETTYDVTTAWLVHRLAAAASAVKWPCNGKQRQHSCVVRTLWTESFQGKRDTHTHTHARARPLVTVCRAAAVFSVYLPFKTNVTAISVLTIIYFKLIIFTAKTDIMGGINALALELDI